MPRESGIEQHGNDLVRALGWWQVKVGYAGWPDRLIIWARGRHFWVEWKKPGGTLTPAQRQRIPRMQTAGEPVFILDSRSDFTALLEVLR
jgi:hypothetical protein